MFQWRGLTVGATLLTSGSGAWAQSSTNEGLGAVIRMTTERFDGTLGRIPEVVAYFHFLPAQFDLRTVLMLIGIFVAGLAAEWVARQLLIRVRHRIHNRGAKSPLRSLGQVMLLDGLAL